MMKYSVVVQRTGSSVLMVTVSTPVGDVMVTLTAWAETEVMKRTVHMIKLCLHLISVVQVNSGIKCNNNLKFLKQCLIYRCSDGLCILKSWTCDGEPDCYVANAAGVAEDEAAEVCGGEKVEPSCPEYKCDNNQCILHR